MLSQRRIARVRSLHRKKERQRQQRFLVEGLKGVEELLKSEFNTAFVLGLAEHLEKFEQEGAEPRTVEFVPADQATIESCSALHHPEGVLAVAEMPDHSFEPASLSHDRPLLAFEALNDPGNLGTLLRIADHFDLRDLLLSEDSVDPYNPKAVRSSMGSLFRQRAHKLDLVQTLRELKKAGRTVVATDKKGPSIHSHPLPKDAILLFGSESQGLSDELRKEANETRGLPALGKVESLNVAVSAGIFCSELLRGEK